MDLSRSLLLNDEALSKLPEAKQQVFVFEWLRFLDETLPLSQKSHIRECQNKLVEQLTVRMQCPHGPPTRNLIARCLATLFSLGDTFLLFDTVNKCNEILRHRDDTSSYLSTKLTAIAVLGCMYESLGRMMGRSYEETIQILTKSLKHAESQTRAEIMVTLNKLCAGMGTVISSVYKDVYKACKHGLTDRAMSVRCSAARCLLEMLNDNSQQERQLSYMLLQTANADFEALVTLCFRAFDGSNYEVHCTVARLLGTLMAAIQCQDEKSLGHQNKYAIKTVSLEEALSLLMSGFLRGGISFLKGTGEMIKGGSSGNREVRVGVTYAYIVFVQAMGVQWLERNLTTFLTHILDLVANPKVASSHVDAVYSRKCISFILHSVLGKMLSEKAQSSSCKEIVHIIVKQMNSLDFNPENAKDYNQETLFGQHLLVCALQEMGRLILRLGTQAQNLIHDSSLNLIEATVSVLVHPCQAARLAAAWCLRCICIAVPSEITPLIDRCVAAIESMNTLPEAIAGYSSALAAVLSSVRYSPLGIPHTKGKIVFNTAEELLRSASQNSRLSLNRTQAGWLLIGSIMTLGIPVVKGLLPRMLLLWRNSFPRSAKELESEKSRGDAFTWQVTLEGRAGALSAMHSFLQHCPELVTEEYIRRLLTPIESALAMLIGISSVLKSYGQQLKAPAAMVRLRMYEAFYLLPPTSFQNSYTHLLRMLISEFTLGENIANTTTSQLQAVCHSDDYVILGTWMQATDHQAIEDQLQPNSAARSGALEHDPCCLYRQLQTDEDIPGPLPLGVAVIDKSIYLFGQIFPHVTNKHRLQMLDHFNECIKLAKASRQEAIQMNVFTALLVGLKGLTDVKGTLGQDVKKSATSLIVSALTAANPVLRCAAGEAVGRISQVVQDSRFTADFAQTSFDRLKVARDVASRTGHSLALGCLHRYVGSLGTSQHLSTSLSILLALAQDLSSPTVQVWSLYALALIADSGGPMFRGYVEPTLSVALKLLLDVSASHVNVHQCIGKLLSALITTIGPELQGNNNSIAATRSSFLSACTIMLGNNNPSVRAEATGCLQQLHLFAPKHVNLSSLVPMLCKTLVSTHLLLRKAAVSCLRQLAQREAKEICDHAITLMSQNIDGLIITELGLPGVLFGLLDTETDARLVKDIHDTLISMLQILAANNLVQWLTLCKSVLTITTETGIANQEEGALDEENDDDQAEFRTTDNKSSQAIIHPRWPTRVFAAECVRRIIAACENDCPQHFDLLSAKELQLTRSHADFLVLHLSDLIRMAFMAITSDSDELRLEGLKTLQVIIDKFARVWEPEFPGHLLLEQFQAQIDAALRQVFLPETPAHVTSVACDVCSTWIRSGVARDLTDLRRVHQLLVSSLSKFHFPVGSLQLYNESMATLEKLSILKAWAEVYVAAMIANGAAPMYFPKQNISSTLSVNETNKMDDLHFKDKSLLVLVQPELSELSAYWLAALRDHALLSLPSEFASQLPYDGGAFYTTDTMESSRTHFLSRWPAILLATTIWINDGGLQKKNAAEAEDNSRDKDAKMQANNNMPAVSATSSEKFHLLFGICLEALCNQRTLDTLDDVITCLQALNTLLVTEWARRILMIHTSLPIELCNVLHRLIITRDAFEPQYLCLKILQLVTKAAEENLEDVKKNNLEESTVNDDVPSTTELDNHGKGIVSNADPGQSLVFAILKVCLCLLICKLPAVDPSTLPDKRSKQNSQKKICKLNEDDSHLVAEILRLMESLPQLCSPQGALSIVPTILFLTINIFEETAIKEINNEEILMDLLPVQAALKCFQSLATHKYATDDHSKSFWSNLLQSALGKLVDLAKTSSDVIKIDENALGQAITVFILYSPSNIINAPNLLFPCINHFRQCLQSDNLKVRLRCIQTLKMIFSHPDRNRVISFIHALAPRLMASLYAYSNLSRDPVICHDFIKTADELNAVLESITVLETLINLAEPAYRIQILTLLVPIMISYLLEPSSLKLSNKNSLQLHESSLQWLMKIGPKYPQEFKALMSKSADMRLRLEAAVKNQAQQLKLQDKAQMSDANNLRSQKSVPTIKLKTDFSNFS